MNNLPAGLIASTTIAQAHPPQKVVDALLIGVDLGRPREAWRLSSPSRRAV